MTDVPLSLRRWFVAHFVVDTLCALPLLLAPGLLLPALGFSCVDPVSPRLVGAALVGIGTQSLIGRNQGVETYRAMLNLKLLWSGTAILGLVMGIADGAPPSTWGFLASFVAFAGVWMHYRIRLKQCAAATE